MKISKIIKTMSIIFICIFVINAQTNIVLCANDGMEDIIGGAEGFINAGKNKPMYDYSKAKDALDAVYNILLVVGIIVAVCIGIMIGIKFMVGGLESKAELKEALVPYIIGCVVVFGAFAIWKVVVTVASTL